MTRIDWFWGALALASTIFGLTCLWVNPSNPALVLLSIAGLAWLIYHADALDEPMHGEDADREGTAK